MRLIGNFYSEWADNGGIPHHTLLVTLVACAVGAIAGATVILSLASSPTTQSGLPSISSRAIVRNIGAPEVPKSAQDGPVDPTPSRRATVLNAPEVPKTVQDGPVEPTLRPAGTNMVSSRDEPVTQTEAEHPADVHRQQSRRYNRVREPYWRRFVHNFSPKPFGSW
jgi:hypothetical protein